MKKIIIVILVVGAGMFLYSCSPKILPIIQATDTDPVTPHFVILSATFAGFENGNKEIKGPVLKKELEGAVVSFSGSFTITPETTYDIQTKHENGGILRNVRIEGDDPCHFSNPNGLIENAFFNEKKVPDSFTITLVSMDSTKYCMTMQLSNNGIYVPKVVQKIVKENVYSNLVRVYVIDKKRKKHFFKFKNIDGSLMENYPLSKLPSRFFKEGKLKSEYKIQKIPVMVKDKEGKLHQKVTLKKVYSRDEAGFKFISSCGIYYLSNKNIYLKNIWVKQDVDDRRILLESRGYQSPNE